MTLSGWNVEFQKKRKRSIRVYLNIKRLNDIYLLLSANYVVIRFLKDFYSHCLLGVHGQTRGLTKRPFPPEGLDQVVRGGANQHFQLLYQEVLKRMRHPVEDNGLPRMLP